MQTRCKKLVRNIIITVISIAIYNIYAFSNTYADDTITITLPSSSVNLPITPTSSGVFNSTDINVQVTTSNTAGYTLSMTAASTNLTRTAAVNETTPIIPTLLSSYSESAFPTGYWGYKLSSDSSFSPIASSITIADPDESTANTAISNVITFAAKLDNSKPAGSYSTTLTFVAVGKTPPVYMQNITYSELSTYLPNVGDSMQMVDNRDGNKYWVTHEADGKFWMTQNLDLCIGCTGTTTLTSENTNLTTSGSGIYSDGYTSSNSIITWTPASTATTSSQTISGTTVSPGFDTSNPTGYNTPYSAEGGDTYYYTSGTTDNDTGTQSTCLAANGNDEEYCKHWHVGNYYNWTAAIASNGSSNISTNYTNAANSICPAGWTLPYGTDSGNTAAYREFGQLFLQAGITTSLTASSYATNGFTNIRTAPLFFVRGGGIVNGSSLNNAAVSGHYWSSSVYSASYAYDMDFGKSLFGNSSYLNSANAAFIFRLAGFSVRCLVRPPKTIDDVSTLQDFASLSADDKQSVLDSMTENQAYEKTDSRDGETYNIAKLADGNIWFLDNLRLDLTNSTVKTKLTSATTNATDTALNCLKNGSCSSPYSLTAVSGTWGEGEDTSTDARINTTYATTINSDSSKNYGNGSHKYGVYYNYCAASAGSYCMFESSTTDGDGSGNANQDICPAGWRMPTGNSTGEWGVLESLINNGTASDSASIQARLSLPLSGRFYDGSADYQGFYGYWWSSTRYNGYSMYDFFAEAASTYASAIDDRYYGNSVRCLFSAS